MQEVFHIAQVHPQSEQVIRVFEGLEEAGKATGINIISIHHALTGMQTQAGGFKWKYVEPKT